RPDRRPAHRAARTGRARLPLHQGAGGAAAQPRGLARRRHPSGRLRRPARALRDRPDRREDRAREHRGRPARLRCALRPGPAALAPNYDAVLCDVWGVIHNGVAAFPEASDALTRFRAKGGTVSLISNAPRPGAQVQRMLDRMGVPRSAYDGIVTSGDVTRDYVAKRPGEPVLLIGPERDHSIFDGLDAPFSTLENAHYVICSGLYDD